MAVGRISYLVATLSSADFNGQQSHPAEQTTDECTSTTALLIKLFPVGRRSRVWVVMFDYQEAKFRLKMHYVKDAQNSPDISILTFFKSIYVFFFCSCHSWILVWRNLLVAGGIDRALTANYWNNLCAAASAVRPWNSGGYNASSISLLYIWPSTHDFIISWHVGFH